MQFLFYFILFYPQNMLPLRFTNLRKSEKLMKVFECDINRITLIKDCVNVYLFLFLLYFGMGWGLIYNNTN